MSGSQVCQREGGAFRGMSRGVDGVGCAGFGSLLRFEELGGLWLLRLGL